MKALAYPFHIDINGHVATIDTYSDVVRGQLIDVLMTNHTERIMRPTYGADMQRALFDPSDTLVRSDAARQVFDRVNTFAPRVILNSVRFSDDKLKPGDLFVDVVYRAGVFQNAVALRVPLPLFLSQESEL